jgi:hypothetical protein
MITSLKLGLGHLKMRVTRTIALVLASLRRIAQFMMTQGTKCAATVAGLKSRIDRIWSWFAVIGKGILLQHWPSALAFAGLAILVGLFSWVWQFEAWHPYAATVAGAVGAVTLASAPFFPNRYLLALIACGAIFTAWVTWFTAVDMTKKTEELTKKDLELARYRDEITRRDHRIGMLKEYLGEFITRLPESEKAEVLTRGGAVTSQRFQEALTQLLPFSDEAVRDVIDLMYRFDKNNGHALYFSGELDWHRRRADHGQTQFYTYLEEEQGLASQFRQNDTSLAACRNPRGYCQQRTAWINHLLANDFYNQARNEEAAGRDAHAKWLSVFRHTCAAKTLHNNVGFEQLTPTATLEQVISQKLPGSTC